MGGRDCVTTRSPWARFSVRHSATPWRASAPAGAEVAPQRVRAVYRSANRATETISSVGSTGFDR
jgi:hypothetical protein